MNLFKLIFAVIIAILFYLTYSHYDGNGAYYLLFTIVANAMLLYSFRARVSFVELFLSIFLWLGFWLKFTLRLLLQNGYFVEVSGSHTLFDDALIVSTIGMLAVIAAGMIRQRFLFNYIRQPELTNHGLFAFYQQFRPWLLAAFALLIIGVTLSNLWFGIYQRGEIPQIPVPFLVSGIYKWLLIFGLAGISAVILRFELELQQRVTILPAGLALAETFLTSVSLLSRAMILNAAALAYGTYLTVKNNQMAFRWRRVLVIGLMFLALFALSIATVNYLRVIKFNVSITETNDMQVGEIAPENALNTSDESELNKSSLSPLQKIQSDIKLVILMTKPLFVDRWVGIEGVLGVLEHGDLGWDLWQEAWQEKYSNHQSSFYDLMINSTYLDIDKSQHHFINLPGMVAFLYYPGSLLFLFLGMVVVVISGTTLEYLSFKLSGQNLIFGALIAQVIVFRITNFGYVPGQSYLLFGTILANLFLLHGAEKICKRFYLSPSY